MPPGPGGQDPVRLSRSATSIGRGAELLSATFLPGRGMNVFQITALIPGHGEVPLLVSPPLASAAGILNGQDEDANGSASTSLGGAILLPWAQRLSGSSTSTAGNAGVGVEWEPPELSGGEPGKQYVRRRAAAEPWRGQREERCAAGWPIGDGNVPCWRLFGKLALDGRGDGAGAVDRARPGSDGDREEYGRAADAVRSWMAPILCDSQRRPGRCPVADSIADRDGGRTASRACRRARWRAWLARLRTSRDWAGRSWVWTT